MPIRRYFSDVTPVGDPVPSLSRPWPRKHNIRHSVHAALAELRLATGGGDTVGLANTIKRIEKSPPPFGSVVSEALRAARRRLQGLTEVRAQLACGTAWKDEQRLERGCARAAELGMANDDEALVAACGALEWLRSAHAALRAASATADEPALAVALARFEGGMPIAPDQPIMLTYHGACEVRAAVAELAAEVSASAEAKLVERLERGLERAAGFTHELVVSGTLCSKEWYKHGESTVAWIRSTTVSYRKLPQVITESY